MFPKRYIFILIFIAAVLLCGREASAATEFVSTIRATDGDYSMLSTWEAAVQSDLTASTTVVYSGTGTGGLPAGTVLELFRGGDYQNITASTTATTTTQILVHNFTGDYKVLQDGDQWRVASSTDNMWTVSSAGLGDSAIAVAECYNDWPTGLVEASGVDIDGWTTNAANYVKVYAPEGERHNGTAKDGEGNYTGFAIKITASGAEAIEVKNEYTIIEGLILDANLIYNGQAVYARRTGANSKFEHLIGLAGALNGTEFLFDFGGLDSGDNFYISNCLGYGNNPKGIFNAYYAGNFYFYNCTAIQTGTSKSGFYFTRNSTLHNTTVKNCLAKSATAGYAFTQAGTSGSASVAYSASSDWTAGLWGGTGNHATSTFTFVDEANDDFHLSSSDSGARNQGTDLSADGSYPITDDIDYTTRPYGWIWDIGADETPSSAFKFNNGTFKIRGTIKFR